MKKFVSYKNNSYSAQFKPQLYLFITSGVFISHTPDFAFYSVNLFLFLIHSDGNSESVIFRYALPKIRMNIKPSG